MRKTEILKQAIFENNESFIKTIYVLHGIIFQSHLCQLFAGIYTKQDISSIIQSLKEHGLVRTYSFFSSQVIVLSNYCIQKLSKNGETNEYFAYNTKTRLKSGFLTSIVIGLLRERIRDKKLNDFTEQHTNKQIEYLIGYQIATENYVRDYIKLELLNEYIKTNKIAVVEKYKTEMKQIQFLQNYFRKSNPEFLQRYYLQIEKKFGMYKEFLKQDINSKCELLEDYILADRDKGLADLLEMLKEAQMETNLLKKKDESLLKTKRKEFLDTGKQFIEVFTNEEIVSNLDVAGRLEQMNCIIGRYSKELTLQELKLKQMLTKIPEHDKKEMADIDEKMKKALEEFGEVQYINPTKEKEIEKYIETLEKRLDGLNLEKKGIDKEIEELRIGTDTLADLRNKFVYVENISLELDRERHNINITIAVADIMHSLTGASFVRLMLETYNYFKLFFYLQDRTGVHEDYMVYNFRFKAYVPNAEKKKSLDSKREYIEEFIKNKGILNDIGLDKIDFEVIDLNLTNTVFSKQAFYRKSENRRVRKSDKDNQELLEDVI